MADACPKKPGSWPVIALLAAACLVCLLPWADKALTADEPLVVWIAQQVEKDPADCFGFDVNWFLTPRPVVLAITDPPLASYYLALFGTLFGWSELVLRLAFLFPTLAAVLGTYCLGRRWCSRPVLAALATLLTPVFLLCGTSVLGDMLMLACWVWAVYLWDRGICDRKSPGLALAGVLMALAALSAYNGVLLIPLLLVHALAVRRRPGWWLLALLVPVLVLGAFERMTYQTYGRTRLLDLLEVTLNQPALALRGFIPTLMIGLAFTGGCVVGILFFAPLLFPGRLLLWGTLAATVLILVSPLLGDFGPHPLYFRKVVRWAFITQGVIFSAAGVGLFVIAVAAFARRRDPQGLLLLLWVLAGFVFGTYMTGAIFGRSFLPLAPAMGILVARRLEQRFGPAPRSDLPLVSGAWCSSPLTTHHSPLTRVRGDEGPTGWHLYWPLVPAGLLALLVVWADYGWAGSARDAAEEISSQYMDDKRTLWFQGHWGFHYYMEGAGGRPMDFFSLHPRVGDIMVVPSNNYPKRDPPREIAKVIRKLRPNRCSWLTTMEKWSGAGFYGDPRGPLPFAFGEPDPEEYSICKLMSLQVRKPRRGKQTVASSGR